MGNTNIDKLLNTTSSGLIAQKLDEKDGTKDGKITASVWNDFVKDKGGKIIKNYISVEDAMRSVMIYAVRQSKSEGTADDIAAKWLNAEKAATPAAKSNNTPQNQDVKTKPDDNVDGKEKASGEADAKDSGKVTQPPITEEERKKAIEEDYDSIKFEIDKKEANMPDKKEVDRITALRKEGKAVADELKTALGKCGNFTSGSEHAAALNALNKITKDNVIYVLESYPDLVKDIDDVAGFWINGFDKDDVIKYVLTPLGQVADDYGYTGKVDGKTVKASEFYSAKAKDWSLEKIQTESDRVAKAIRNKQKDRIIKYNKDLEQYNADLKYNKQVAEAQKVLDAGNKFIAEVVNMDKDKLKIESEDNGKRKTVTLPDGRKIRVDYDKDGNPANVYLSHDTSKISVDGREAVDDWDIVFEDGVFITSKTPDGKGYTMFDTVDNFVDYCSLKHLFAKIFG